MTPFFTLQIWPSLGTWVAWPGDALLRVGGEYVKVHAAGGSRFRKDLNSQNISHIKKKLDFSKSPRRAYCKRSRSISSGHTQMSHIANSNHHSIS